MTENATDFQKIKHFAKLRENNLFEIVCFLQASTQGGLIRPYQDHLSGLDRAFERPWPLKGLQKAFKRQIKGFLSGLESLLKTSKTTLC